MTGETVHVTTNEPSCGYFELEPTQPDEYSHEVPAELWDAVEVAKLKLSAALHDLEHAEMAVVDYVAANDPGDEVFDDWAAGKIRWEPPRHWRTP